MNTDPSWLEALRWWQDTIPATGDDTEIWRLEGAIAELRSWRDDEAESEEERANVSKIITALSSRHSRVVLEVRCPPAEDDEGNDA